MTQLTLPRSAVSPEPDDRSPWRGSQRDAAVDLVRAVCLTIVLVLHISMAGVAVVGGDISITNAVENEGWFAPLTWLLQVMPLFFMIGGFAARAQWMRLRARGARRATSSPPERGASWCLRSHSRRSSPRC